MQSLQLSCGMLSIQQQLLSLEHTLLSKLSNKMQSLKISDVHITFTKPQKLAPSFSLHNSIHSTIKSLSHLICSIKPLVTSTEFLLISPNSLCAISSIQKGGGDFKMKMTNLVFKNRALLLPSKRQLTFTTWNATKARYPSAWCSWKIVGHVISQVLKHS